MIKRTSVFVGLLVGLSVFSLTAAAVAMEFSADVITKVKGQTMVSKIIMANDKYRTENKIAGQTSISIVRMDKKKVWMLMPAQKMYIESSYADVKQAGMGMSQKNPGEITRKKIGRETVNGVPCDKYEITYKGPNGAETMYQWISKDNWPMRSAAKNGAWSTEYKNFKKGPQPAKVFELPAGYKKMAIPGMKKGMMKF